MTNSSIMRIIVFALVAAFLAGCESDDVDIEGGARGKDDRATAGVRLKLPF